MQKALIKRRVQELFPGSKVKWETEGQLAKEVFPDRDIVLRITKSGKVPLIIFSSTEDELFKGLTIGLKAGLLELHDETN